MSTEDVRAGELAPRLDALIDAELLVPIRSSSGAVAGPRALVDADAFRHGTDDEGERFIAAFTSPDVAGRVRPARQRQRPHAGARPVRARRCGAGARRGRPGRADAGRDRGRRAAVPGRRHRSEPARRAARPSAAGRPAAARGARPGARAVRPRAARRPRPTCRRSSARGCCAPARRGPRASSSCRTRVLGDFDAVRNRLHAVATEHLGSRRLLAVTDLRAPVLRDMYDATAAPFFVRRSSEKKSIFGRIFGG